MTKPPTNEELLLWLRDTEHSFVERKVFSDSRDWLKTVVAFANSTPIDYPAVLFIGVKDNGEPDGARPNLDEIQKTLSQKISPAYPEIYTETRILDVGGRQVLAVVVPGSGARPHFAGPAYVREMSRTVRASEKQFDKLIAERNNKAYEILRWKGKPVVYAEIRPGASHPQHRESGTVVNCNQHYVTLDLKHRVSLPLNRIDISFDDIGQKLELTLLPV